MPQDAVSQGTVPQDAVPSIPVSRDEGCPGPGPDAPLGLLGQVLRECAADRRSGTLRVLGEPGGTVHIADGGVTSIETPGAPGPEVVLVRSGRVAESAWAAAFTAAAADGRMAAELVRRELVGHGELEALLRTVLADAMFTLASGEVDQCRMEPPAAACLLPLEPPAEPGWLLAETSRRHQVLASLPSPVGHDRDRVTRGPAAIAPLDGRQDEILALANGRRTARDMAFVLGCGVYALTLEFARMRESGLLAVGSRRQAGNSTPGRPDPRAGRPVSDSPVPDSSGPDGSGPDGSGPDGHDPADSTTGPGAAPALPRRRKANPGQPRSGPTAVAQGGASALLRLLRPGPVADHNAGQ